MKLPPELSQRVFSITEEAATTQWLRDVERAVGGLRWTPLGGIPNNVHSIEVATDSASAIVERATNAIDAVIDLQALLRSETAATPHKAAQQWLGAPEHGVSNMRTSERQKLANAIRIINLESGVQECPTIVIEDCGTGQHPSDFPSTLLSLGESNKKSKTHQIGVYNAGGASTYNFCPYTFVVARRAPSLLDGRADEVGVTVVRYNELDPNKFKSGIYEYCVDSKGGILTLDLPGNDIPEIGHGAYIKHIAYELHAYSRAAHEPKRSLHHLFNAALPDPPLPFWVEETRADRFPAIKTGRERRVLSGLVARLKNAGVADYSDEREIKLGQEYGSVTLRYFLLNDDQEADAFVTPSQGLAFVLHGQRHGTQDRYWVRRNTGYNYIWARLIILVDCDQLTNAAKRQVFSSTRESSKLGPLPELIKKRVIEELKDDDELAARDEEARERTLAAATRAASEKVKKQLAEKIAPFIRGRTPGRSGGEGKPPKPTPKDGPRKPRKPRNIDDSTMLDVPDVLKVVTSQIEITPGRAASFRIHVNAKNDFLPTYSKYLSVVVGKGLQDTIQLSSSGRLLGGYARISLRASSAAPIGASDTVTVTLVIPELSVALMAQTDILVVKSEEDDESKSKGGDLDIDVNWIGREKWDTLTPPWDENTVGVCFISRQDPRDPQSITRVEWLLNEAFKPYDSVIETKKLSEAALQKYRESYQIPVCWALFNQTLAEETAEKLQDDEGRSYDLPDSYVKGERARLAQAILLAMEPEMSVSALELGAA